MFTYASFVKLFWSMNARASSGGIFVGRVTCFAGTESISSARPESRRSLVAYVGDLTASSTMKAASFFPSFLRESFDAWSSLFASFVSRSAVVERSCARFDISENSFGGLPRFVGVADEEEEEEEEEGGERNDVSIISESQAPCFFLSRGRLC